MVASKMIIIFLWTIHWLYTVDRSSHAVHDEYHVLQDSSHIGVWIIDVCCNRSCCCWLQYVSSSASTINLNCTCLCQYKIWNNQPPYVLYASTAIF